MQGIQVKCCVPYPKEMTVEERPMYGEGKVKQEGESHKKR